MTTEIIDQASELEELLRNNAIQAHRINHNAVSAKHCIDCGDDIPELRRVKVLGCQRCASCQGDFEKKQGRM
jgi:phage/conjugal plasmid C-4 type zinc finger TraR family protein